MSLDCDPHICAQCAAQGPTCCRIEPGSEEFCFPLSDMEWERIRDCLGGAVAEKGGFATQINTSGFMTQMHRLFPDARKELALIFPPHRPHLRLATRVDGSCVFLGPEGCGLEREARPYYCRLFPFWVQSGRVVQFNPAYCFAVAREPELRGLLHTLSMSAADVLRLHGQLRLAWGLDPKETTSHPTDASIDAGSEPDTSDTDE